MNNIQKVELKFMSERDDNARVLDVWLMEKLKMNILQVC
jgi:hypothetical protein